MLTCTAPPRAARSCSGSARSWQALKRTTSCRPRARCAPWRLAVTWVLRGCAPQRLSPSSGVTLVSLVALPQALDLSQMLRSTAELGGVLNQQAVASDASSKARRRPSSAAADRAPQLMQAPADRFCAARRHTTPSAAGCRRRRSRRRPQQQGRAASPGRRRKAPPTWCAHRAPRPPLLVQRLAAKARAPHAGINRHPSA